MSEAQQPVPTRVEEAMKAPTPTVFDRETHPTEFGRLLALSDGVFAIALTLLVLDLALPMGAAEGALFNELVNRQAHFAAFGLSLLFIGSAWWSHHHLFSMLQGFNGKAATINILYLGFVALLPFAQGVLAAYPSEPLAYVLFAGLLAAFGVADTGLFLFARRNGLLTSRVTHRASQAEIVYGAVFVLVLLVSMPLAYVIGPYTALLWLSLPFMGLVHMRLQSGQGGPKDMTRLFPPRWGGRQR